MEFFRIIERTTTEGHIQEYLRLDALEKMTNLLFVIGDQTPDQAAIGGLWGEFTLTRSDIKGGLRFALKECPNALAWTITTGYPPAREAIVIHLTINRQQKKSEFLEEIAEFLEDHEACLQAFFSSSTITDSAAS